MASDQGSDAAEFKGNDLFGSKEERREGVPRFPLRPLEPDCYFYRKTGYCRYGQLCMFNHPPPPKRFVQAKMRNNPSRSDQAAEEASNRVRKMECRDPAARTLSASKQNVRHTSVISGAKADHGINLRAKAEEHPEGRIQSTHSNIPPTGPTTVTVSPTGLPLRPGQPVCMYYSRYGLCKYGIGCGYDHPVGCGATSMLSSDQFPILNSRRKIV